MRTRNEIEISLIELSQEYKKKKTTICREIARMKKEVRNTQEELNASIEKIHRASEQRVAKETEAANRLLAAFNENILEARADYENAEEEYLEKKKALLRELDSTDEVKPII